MVSNMGGGNDEIYRFEYNNEKYACILHFCIARGESAFTSEKFKGQVCNLYKPENCMYDF